MWGRVCGAGRHLRKGGLLDNRSQLERFLAGVETRAYRIALYGLGNREDALDVVQDAMMQLARRYADKPEEQWPPLFYRVLRNRISDWQRRRTVRQRVMAWLPFDREHGEEPVSLFPDPAGKRPEEELALTDAMDALDAAIVTLAPRQQEALLLRMIEGLNVADTAVAMGCSEGSVKTHYSRAVHELRSRLGDHWP